MEVGFEAAQQKLKEGVCCEVHLTMGGVARRGFRRPWQNDSFQSDGEARRLNRQSGWQAGFSVLPMTQPPTTIVFPFMFPTVEKAFAFVLSISLVVMTKTAVCARSATRFTVFGAFPRCGCH